MLQNGRTGLAIKESLKKQLADARLEIESFQRELREKEAQVRNLIRDTLDAQEAERERICLEVHDGVTQTMASVFQYLQALEPSRVLKKGLIAVFNGQITVGDVPWEGLG